MKNIHLLPTEKPSRLIIQNGNKLILGVLDYSIIENRQHIYITNSEEIKEDNWGLSKLNEVILFGRSYNEKFYKKIILTTDLDLIKDGVQAIDDEFLKWFIKNPSCEFVEWDKNYNRGNGKYYYKIIIPQEESDKEFKRITASLKRQGPEAFAKCEKSLFDLEQKLMFGKKQETLEEAAENMWLDPIQNLTSKMSFINGAKWQAERMYSEVIEFAEWIRIKDFQTTSKDNWIGLDMKYYTTQELFEQFKKK